MHGHSFIHSFFMGEEDAMAMANIETEDDLLTKGSKVDQSSIEIQRASWFWKNFESDDEVSATRRYLRITRASQRYSLRRRSMSERVYEFCKRMMDIVIALPVVLILAPIVLALGLATKLYDGGPMFFRQVRVGRFGEPFMCYKIRTMVPNADALKYELLSLNHHEDGVTFKVAKDPRITPLGLWLRKLSLDELPQLINVLQGQMSLVGPRPAVPGEVAKYEGRDFQRLLVKPGITCIWQVSGRGDVDFGGQVAMDVQYVRSRSLWLDLRLMLKTIPAVLSMRGAY
jgi:lipopolysaccharide/colanic/teichoic acid biosynthesis glycosyltransferase